ncbi:MAG: mechanosensitive ion channel domain-containing protein [Opitutaceae bacterium]
MNPILAAVAASETAIVELQNSVIGRLYSKFAGRESTPLERIFLILVLALGAHLAAKFLRDLSEWIIIRSHAKRNPFGFMTEKPKFITVTRLMVSAITFMIIFFALGLILQEFGVNLTAYLASASIIGLAISFGSQGLIQDIVIGLTLIFWDAMDVGDMVEITGAAVVIGRVEEIGLRFTKVRNVYNQEVFVPNRTIANVSRFPAGGLDAYADIQLPAGTESSKAAAIARDVARGMWMQFDALILSEPTVSDMEALSTGGWSFYRVHFKIWPGQGGLIENAFRQQIVRAMRTLDPAYADWQVAVTYRATTVRKPPVVGS